MPRGIYNRNNKKESPKAEGAVESGNAENTVASEPIQDTKVVEVQDKPVAKTREDALAEQNKILMEQLAALEKKIEAMEQNGGKVVMAKPEENVELTYIAAVSPNNVLSLGEYGTLNGVGGYIEVPRKEFGGKFLTPEVRGLLRDRRLIVLNGLNEDERKRYGVDYKGEELLDMQMFDRLLDMPLDRLKEIFTKLCPEHRQVVATRFISAYQKGDNRISREKVEPLNDLSKMPGKTEDKGMFYPILAGMNKL